MAIEVVDKKNPSLIRPAVVTMVDEYDIKILFIGWPEKYAYWLKDDDCNIFAPGYAKKTNHPIECPLGNCSQKTNQILSNDLNIFHSHLNRRNLQNSGSQLWDSWLPWHW